MASSRTQALPSIRISAPQLELLVADLTPLYRRMLLLRSNHSMSRALGSVRGDLPFEDCQLLTARLWKELSALKCDHTQERYRLKLLIFEAGLCITAVRAAMRTRGCSVPRSEIPNTGVARTRRSELLRKLENYQRQLYRRNECGDSPTVVQLHARFAQYRKMMVHELFRPLPTKPRGCKDLRRRVFKSLVTIAEEGLKEAFSAVPPDKQLRKLVSQWLQDVLRYRSDITMRPLLSDPSIGKEPLVRYIQRRWAKMSPVPPDNLATRQALVSQALREVMPDLDGDDRTEKTNG
jgi:hypothetical protein